MTSKTVEVWIVMGENGDYEVAPDEDAALERLIDGSSEDLADGLPHRPTQRHRAACRERIRCGS